MPVRAWTRRAAVAAVVLALGAAVPVVGERVALSELRGRGFAWESVHRSAQAWGVDGVTRPGVRVETVRVGWQWPLRVRLAGVAVDVEQLGHTGRASLAQGSSGVGDVALDLEGVDIRAGDWLLGEGLAGSREDGRLDLGGPGTEVQVADGRVRLRATRPSPLPELQGALDIQAELDRTGALSATLVGRDLVLRHPLLATRPLPLTEVRATLTRDGATVSGPVTVAGLTVAFSATCDADCRISLTLPETPAAKALAPLAPLLPELRRARRLDGTVSARVVLDRGDDGWQVVDASLDVADLAVDGAVEDLDSLRYGPFAYRVRDAEGDPRVRESGEGTRDWVALSQVSPWVIEAILASEDAAFRRHRGYDPAQIREALAADLAAGEVVRGGSTLSQQLAKNLFLSGERTMIRKVRELLLAVELDRVLGKSRELELYVNVVEWGPEIYGLAQACDRYFLKQPARIQPHEAAFLAAILPAPRTFYDDWYLAGRAGRYKVGSVLTNMADLGAMSHRQAAHWSGEPLRFVPPPR